MLQFHITRISPAGYLHAACLAEVIEALTYSLEALGHSVSTSTNQFRPGATNLLIGSHLLTEELALAIPPGSVLYNLEQLGGPQLSPVFLAAACLHQVWDYSALNLQHWARLPCRNTPRLLEPGFVPQLRRIESAPVQDIDVLFYGSLNPRRQDVLQALSTAGLHVVQAFGFYGKERDALIARARVVVNIHFYDTQVFEVVRISYLLNNAKAVVTEWSPDIGRLAAAVLACPYAELVPQVLALLADEPRRLRLESDGARIFAERTQVELLRPVLGMSDAKFDQAPAVASATNVPYPRRLNLGSGKDWREDCLNIDINDYWRPDAVLDIAQPLPPIFELSTNRFGTILMGDSSFDTILANDVLEHIPNLVAAMTTALRLLSPGGLFEIQVPYDLSFGAWQDPTHVRAFNERSWLYYTDWFWYLGWTEARFSVRNIEFVLSSIGERLRESAGGEDLLRQPRAVDMMRLTLQKQPLSDAEKALVANYLKRPARAPAGLDSLTPMPSQVVPPAAPTAPHAKLQTPAQVSLPAVRKLYLDMVQRSVINTIYEDPNGDRWSPHTYDKELRERGRDWPAQAHSMIGNQRMTNLRELAESVIKDQVPGDFIETGVWRGGACIMMRAVLKAYQDTSRRVWVADSFRGLPAPRPGVAGDAGDEHHTYTELLVSSDQVRSNFAKYDLLDEQVRFLEGWFSETLPNAPIEKLAILRLDGDMYESTRDALHALYDKISAGGFIIVDDFGAVPGCRQAILEFREERGITAAMHNIDDIGVFWCKQLASLPHDAVEDPSTAASIA